MQELRSERMKEFFALNKKDTEFRIPEDHANKQRVPQSFFSLT